MYVGISIHQFYRILQQVDLNMDTLYFTSLGKKVDTHTTSHIEENLKKITHSNKHMILRGLLFSINKYMHVYVYTYVYIYIYAMYI